MSKEMNEYGSRKRERSHRLVRPLGLFLALNVVWAFPLASSQEAFMPSRDLVEDVGSTFEVKEMGFVSGPGDVFPDANDFALAHYAEGTIEITALARSGLAIDLMVIGLEPLVSGTIQVEGPMPLIERPFFEETVVLLRDLPSTLDPAFRITLLDSLGQLVDDTGFVALAAMESPVGDGESAFVPPEGVEAQGGGCIKGGTWAQELRWYGGSAKRTSGISSAAQALAFDAVESDWNYKGRFSDGTVVGNRDVPDIASYGHGFYGANKVRSGNDYDLAAGLSIMGNENVQRQWNNCARGYISVGHVFTLADPQVFHNDVRAIIANHVDAWEKGRPSTGCSTAMPTFLKAALGLTRAGGYIEPLIPDKFCGENWKRITSAKGRSGLGIQSGRSSSKDYEGAETYIRTHYSSTGHFKMEFGAYVNYKAIFTACKECTSYKVNYWTGFDESRMWSVAQSFE